MDRYKYGIDFVIVTVGERGAKYTEWCVRSIEKYVKDVDYNVYIVANYQKDWEKERDILKDTLDHYKNINLVKGYSEEYSLEPSAAGGYENTGRRIYSKLDNAPMSYGCYCHAKGMELGIKSGDGKYVCILDNDSIFLNEWFPIILEKEYDEEVENGMVKVISIPDIESVNYGRGVGYEINEFMPPEDIGKISATKIREGLNKNE